MLAKGIEWVLAFAIIPFCQPAVAQASSADYPDVHSLTVNVPFVADDGHGNPISGITQSELSILDDSKPPRVVLAIRSGKQLPLRLVLLIDTSNSERTSGLYQAGVKAASELLNEVVNQEDKVSIVTFAVTPNGTTFMSRDELLKFKVDLTPGGGTALFDAVYFACKERMAPDPIKPARRILVILSDGGDNMSHVDHDKVIAAAQESETVIFALAQARIPMTTWTAEGWRRSRIKQGGAHSYTSAARTFLRLFPG